MIVFFRHGYPDSECIGDPSVDGSGGGNEDSSNSGILSGVFDWLRSIKTAITGLPGLIADKLGIAEHIQNIVSTVTSIPSKIIDGIKGFFENLISLVTDLPNKILDGIKFIFIPKDGFFEDKVQQLTDKFNTVFGVQGFDLSSIFGKEQKPQDITCVIMGNTVTIVRMDLIDIAIQKFRPVIRGFLVLMIVFYNLNQFLSFIGQAPITFGGIIRTLKEGNGDDN